MAAALEKLWLCRGCLCCGRGTGKGAEAFPGLQLTLHASTLSFGLQGKGSLPPAGAGRDLAPLPAHYAQEE